MDDKIIATFCLCDDLLKALHHQEDRQCQMNDAEIMTTALIASLCFRGNQESARTMLKQYGYIPQMVSKSRFSRRLHRIKDLFRGFFDLLSHTWQTLNTDAVYMIDSIPIAVAYSTPKLPLIPCQSCHLFHTKVATDSTAQLPPIPREACH